MRYGSVFYMTNTTISRETAEKVLASVKARYTGLWDNNDAPVLSKNYMDTGNWGIVWEDGPYEWAYRVVSGGISGEVFDTLRYEFGVDGTKARRIATEPPLKVPSGVEMLEPYYSYSVVIVGM